MLIANYTGRAGRERLRHDCDELERILTAALARMDAGLHLHLRDLDPIEQWPADYLRGAA